MSANFGWKGTLFSNIVCSIFCDSVTLIYACIIIIIIIIVGVRKLECFCYLIVKTA